MRRLCLLTVLALAAAPAVFAQSYRHGRVRHVEEGVSIQRATETGSEEATANLPFLPGDRVWTDGNGRAEFQFAGGSLLRLDRASKLDYVAHEDGRDERLVLRLWSGALYLHLRDRRDGPFEVETPGGVVTAPAIAPSSASTWSPARRACPSTTARPRSTAPRPCACARASACTRAGARSPKARPRSTGRKATSSRSGTTRARSGPNTPATAGQPARRRRPLRGRARSSRRLVLRDRGRQRLAALRGRRVAAVLQRPLGVERLRLDLGAVRVVGLGRLPLRAMGLHAPSLGWYWIPGATWSPAWVSWAAGGDYVGWCPLGYRDRPVLVYDRLGRGNRGFAVPRGGTTVAQTPWTYLRRGDVAPATCPPARPARQRSVRQVRVLESAQSRLTRDLVVADVPPAAVARAVPRGTSSRPGMSDTVPEMRGRPDDDDPGRAAPRPIPSKAVRIRAAAERGGVSASPAARCRASAGLGRGDAAAAAPRAVPAARAPRPPTCAAGSAARRSRRNGAIARRAARRRGGADAEARTPDRPRARERGAPRPTAKCCVRCSGRLGRQRGEGREAQPRDGGGQAGTAAGPAAVAGRTSAAAAVRRSAGAARRRRPPRGRRGASDGRLAREPPREASPRPAPTPSRAASRRRRPSRAARRLRPRRRAARHPRKGSDQ